MAIPDPPMSPAPPIGRASLAALRQFMRAGPAAETCELCRIALTPDHEHLLELATRRLQCCCTACALLFSGRQDGRFRRVPRRIEFLADFRLTEPQWDELRLPINLAFFFRSTPAGRVVAAYPSPAGATESLLTLEAWLRLEAENPVLSALEPDVESLLVNRVGTNRHHFRAPIDECYRLVGLIRKNWRGLSGGTEVWSAIDRFFTDLKNKAQGASVHA